MRRFLLVLAVGALTTLNPASASAAPLLLWTLVVSPLTAVANQSTTFTFNATNVDAVQDLGCLEVDLPSSFVIEGTGTPTASNGRAWDRSVSVGNVVMVYSLSGGGRLNPGEVVTFTIRTRPTVAGPFSLPNHSHVSQNCNGTDQPGLAVPITVLPGATPTSIPTPTPRPTPRPTPTPLPLPTLPLPTLPLPSVLPTAPPPGASPSASASPGSVFASSSPRASGSPASSRSADPSAPGPGPAGGGPSAGGTGESAPQVRLEPADLALNMQLSDLLGSAQVWFVPAAAIGAPGLLVLLWVLLQTAGTLVWIPFVRRMRGEKPVRSGRFRRVLVR